MLEPNFRAQDEIRRGRATKALQAARTRQIAWFMLFGGCIGGVIGYFTEAHVARSVFVGAAAGSFAGWFAVWLRAMSRPT